MEVVGTDAEWGKRFELAENFLFFHILANRTIRIPHASGAWFIVHLSSSAALQNETAPVSIV